MRKFISGLLAIAAAAFTGCYESGTDADNTSREARISISPAAIGFDADGRTTDGLAFGTYIVTVNPYGKMYSDWHAELVGTDWATLDYHTASPDGAVEKALRITCSANTDYKRTGTLRVTLSKTGESVDFPITQVGLKPDEHFNQKEFLEQVASCPQCPRSSCPSPESYRQAFESEAEHIYVVTLSGNLSGSYNSAMVGRQMYLEEDESKQIYVMDSCSASCGETQLALLAASLEEQGLSFEEVVSRLEAFRSEMNTYFVLDNLETLRKNGRLSGIKALVASTLSIKPVMAGTMDGRIEQIGQGIGIRKGLQKMADAVVRNVARPEEKTLMITHCNCPERAESVKRMVTSKVSVKDVVIMDTAGVSSMYANDGGVIVTI